MTLKLSDKYLKGIVSEEDIKAITPEIIAAHNTLVSRSGEGNDFLGEPISVVWKSKTTDFGIPVKRKRLDGIAFFTKSDATVTVSADGNTKKFSVKGGGVARLRPMMRGDRFSLRFESEGGEVEISDILLTLKYYL